MIQHERLLACLRYEPETGIWTRLRGCRGHSAKQVVGRICHNGYRQIGFEGKRYQEHRLAVFYMTGEWPCEQIDHRDLDKANNRWANLRYATPSQQRGNVAVTMTNTSGMKGATWNKRCHKWQASCRHKYLGIFETKELAHAAYMAAASAYYGEFARAE